MLYVINALVHTTCFVRTPEPTSLLQTVCEGYVGEWVLCDFDAQTGTIVLSTPFFASIGDSAVASRDTLSVTLLYPNAYLYVCAECSSTQDIAWCLIEHGHFPVWSCILAQSQTTGRGQYNRIWHSVSGNLFMSIRIPNNVCCTKKIYFPLLLAAQVAYFLRSLQYNAYVKWINDIVIDDAKVAGLLLEEKNSVLVLGIGCNVHTVPVVTVQPKALNKVTALAEKQRCTLSIQALCEHLRAFMYTEFSRLKDTSWNEQKCYITSVLWGYNSLIRLRTELGDKIGRFVDITEECSISLAEEHAVVSYCYETILGVYKLHGAES